MGKFKKVFRGLPDPRADNAQHELADILFIALAALLCGAETSSDMAEFGLAKEEFFRQILVLKHGIPSHDTFSRVFRLLDPQAFAATFRQFMAAFAEANKLDLSGVVAIDGKALRGVLERGGDYVLALKENQSSLFAAVKRRFARAGKRSVAERLELSTHDRREHRRATVIRDTTLVVEHDFPGIAAVARITSRRRVHDGRAKPPVVRYFLLSQYVPARTLLRIQRSHWTVENQLHWVLDVVLDEDRSRTRKDNAPENLAILRGFVLNILRSHPSTTPMRRKIKRAGWDNAFLIELLDHMR